MGAIADRLLEGTRAGREARKLLRGNLRVASVWADCVRGVDEETLTYSVRGRFPECASFENDAGEAQMIAFVKRNLANCKPRKGADSCHRQYHYTDVAIQRDTYSRAHAGTSDHDLVSAIHAAIAVLRGNESPAPFRIANRKEALRLLVHYIGDLHQPLHVGAVYLDARGQVVDPDKGRFSPATKTGGGNALNLDGRTLHAHWDSTRARWTRRAGWRHPARPWNNGRRCGPRNRWARPDWPIRTCAIPARMRRDNMN